MSPGHDLSSIAFLQQFARGQTPAARPQVGEAPPRLCLRAKADILRAARGPLRALQIELFRAQAEFNHALVDLLEDLPWHAASGVPRLERVWHAAIPRLGGARGKAVYAAKHFALDRLVRWPPVRALIAALERLNSALQATCADPTDAQALVEALEALPEVRGFEPLIAAQREFAEALHRTTSRFGGALVAASQPRPPEMPARLPDVSVLVVGGAEGRPTFDALEVLDGDVSSARGRWILRVPADERLVDAAALASALARTQADLVYGDSWVEGHRQLKPGWSPEYLLNDTYVGGCFAMRTAVAQAHGLTRADAPLKWLLAPRFSASQVERLPAVISARAAPLDQRPDVAALRALEPEAIIEEYDGRRVVRFLPRPVRVSIIVPFRDKVDLLKGLWQSLSGIDAGLDWELILMSNRSTEPQTAAFLATLSDPRVSVHRWDHEFNYSTINNLGARHAKGEVLLFLNNDVEVLHQGWLAELVGYLQRPGVEVVGARLLYGDGSLQHAGVVIGVKGLAAHLFARWRPGFGATAFGRPDVTRNWSAVTGACLLMRRERFEAIGGFDERFRIAGGDVELCLRACGDGGRVACVSHVELAHFESVSRGRAPVPLGDVRAEVGAYLPLLERGDPFGHPLLATDSTAGTEALTPDAPADHVFRALAPWLE